jgi:hypothetical protein
MENRLERYIRHEAVNPLSAFELNMPGGWGFELQAASQAPRHALCPPN